VSRATAFWAVGFAFFVTMLGATLPTPLYPIYGRTFGITPVFITVIFAAYAVGVLASLLLFGRLSDQLGRRPVLIPGLMVSIASSVVFLVASDTALLYVGRVLSGLSAGVFTGTATATLVDLAPGGRRALATGFAVAFNLGGLAAGGLLAGVLADAAPAPLRSPYVAHLVLLVPATVGVLLIPETSGRPASERRFRLQRLQVPSELRGIFGGAATVGFCGFAVSALFGAVTPTVLVRLLGLSSHTLAGLLIFLLMSCSATGQLMTNRLSQRRAFSVGCLLLLVGLGCLAAALLATSLAWLIVSALAAGAGQGLVIGSGLAAINTRVSLERRSEAASTYFVVLYIGLMLPVVGEGFASNAIGLQHAGTIFTAIVAAIVLVVLAGLAARRAPGFAASTSKP
jgi:MFS family permease